MSCSSPFSELSGSEIPKNTSNYIIVKGFDSTSPALSMECGQAVLYRILGEKWFLENFTLDERKKDLTTVQLIDY